jgi:hypothetical protein
MDRLLSGSTALLQTALLGLRWCEILDALSLCNERMTRAMVIGITAIGAFFTQMQILPNIAGEGMRVWLVTRPLAVGRRAGAGGTPRLSGAGIMLGV